MSGNMGSMPGFAGPAADRANSNAAARNTALGGIIGAARQTRMNVLRSGGFDPGRRPPVPGSAPLGGFPVNPAAGPNTQLPGMGGPLPHHHPAQDFVQQQLAADLAKMEQLIWDLEHAKRESLGQMSNEYGSSDRGYPASSRLSERKTGPLWEFADEISRRGEGFGPGRTGP